MKTSFTRAYCLRQHRPTYLYHGIPMQCFAPFTPGYFKGYDLTPITPPATYAWECDVKPNLNTPPLTLIGQRDMTPSYTDGNIYHMQAVPFFSGSAYEAWKFASRTLPAHKVIIRASVPVSYWVYPNATQGQTFELYPTLSSYILIMIHRIWQYIGGVMTLTTSECLAYVYGHPTVYLPYTTEFEMIIEKTATPGKVNITLQGILIATNYSLTNYQANFYTTYQYTGSHIGVDFIRVYES